MISLAYFYLSTMLELFQSSKGITCLIGIVLVIVLRRWHFYRFIRPYVAPISIAVFVHFVTSSEYRAGSLFTIISENLDSLYLEFAHLSSVAIGAWIPSINFAFASNVTKDIVVLLGVWSIINHMSSVYNWARELIPHGLMYFLKYIGDKGFQQIKHLPIVQHELNKEKSKFEADMETGVKAVARGVGNGIINYSLPKQGLDKQEVLKHMIAQSRLEDGKWEGGKLSGVSINCYLLGMYCYYY